MCGIAGIANLDPAAVLEPAVEHSVRLMTDSMAYRGPNGDGVLLRDSVCLGHRRLSIIDLSGGAQPMWDSTGTLCIVFNGEIYNFLELRRELEEQGLRFQTSSDTEVILAAYRRWGTDCLERLDGMFTFALWDTANRRLFGARDRFGKKPFFYTVQNGRFHFASELSCLRHVPGLQFTLDEHALMRYLAYQYVPCPDTMFREAAQLPPAHGFVLENGSLRIFKYWELPLCGTAPVDETEACEELNRLMRTAVRRRMISDVPLGVFLSGGIDSSIVTGLMAEISDTPVQSFSIGFHEASYDESRYAHIVAEAFSTHHEERVLNADECADMLPQIVSSMDVPMADASVAPQWLLAKMTREHVTVALGGDGSDELWCGYEHYIGFDIAERYNRAPSFLRRGIIEPICHHLPASSGYINLRLATGNFLRAAAQPSWLRIQSMLTACPPEMQERILNLGDKSFLDRETLYAPTRAAYFQWPEAVDLHRACNTYVQGFLLDDILVKVDRCSMLNSLEVRAPFLDRSVAEFTARLPMKCKLNGLKRKYLLKKAFAGLLPEQILHRNKRGFQIPVSQWLRGRLRPLMEDLLGREAIERQGFFNAGEIRRLMDDHISGRSDLRVPLWTLMVFQLWWRNNVAR
ncbi:MAG: asparagine synthase (glutamine-hydrolyzing) [Desulfovibrionaceae bacterium]|nr:asparagine synthase (glutamine-hydrolyzing) [Desulfovibrionaceae bacterium]